MLEVLIAIIGLIGTIAAGNAFSEWLKRRNVRESIKGDLEVWNVLPDNSEAKANLLSGIERRVEQLPSDADWPRTRWAPARPFQLKKTCRIFVESSIFGSAMRPLKS